MGTWDAGPFGNDAAMDFVGDVIRSLTAPLDEFLADPQIDETFDPAFAAIALLNEVMTRTVARPWDPAAEAPRDPRPIAEAMLRCFDEQIAGMAPAPGFEADQRAALVAELDRFVALGSR
ncbi:MAG: DUF4259 domain-containing protein [Myxococcota bacterium]